MNQPLPVPGSAEPSPSANADGERWKLPVAIAVGALLYLSGIGFLWFEPFEKLPLAQSSTRLIEAGLACFLGATLPLAACAWSKRWWKYHKAAAAFGVSLICIEMILLHLRDPIHDKSSRWSLIYATAAALFAVWGIWRLRQVRKRERESGASGSQQSGSSA